MSAVRAVLDLARFFSFFPLFFLESPGRVKKVIRSDFLGNFQTEYHKYNGFNNCLSFIRRFLPHNWVCACSHAFIVCWFEKSRPCLFRTNLVNSACVRLNRCMQPPISFPYPSGYGPISIQRKGQGLPLTYGGEFGLTKFRYPIVRGKFTGKIWDSPGCAQVYGLHKCVPPIRV